MPQFFTHANHTEQLNRDLGHKSPDDSTISLSSGTVA